MASIAVIGAGLAGLACAREVELAGHDVHVFEKSRGFGGRLATRRADAGAFDHGAQYFTARDPQFRETVDRWRSENLVAVYTGRIATIGNGKAVPVAPSEPRFVGVPGMNSIAHALAEGTNVVRECVVTGVVREDGVWRVEVGDERRTGRFDAVVIAVPAVQAVPLLAAAPELAAQAAAARYAPCWAVLADLEAFADPGFDAAFVLHSPLAWIMRDASKPGREAGGRWVLHGEADWSASNLEWEAERVVGTLLDAFGALVRREVRANWAVAHRWRYALTSGLGTGFLWNGAARIGAAGDWCSDGRIEGAWLSGVRLGRAISAVA